MLQLEFFPRTELRSLLDFQSLVNSHLSLKDRKQLAYYPEFYQCPKSNMVFKYQHAQLVDEILGVRVKYIEEMLVAEAKGFEAEGSHETWGPLLHEGVQTWVGLELQTLQTPYSECFRILQLLKIKPYQHIIDLGAAYGRMGMVVGGLFIKNSFTGYEYVKARVDEGNRVYRELDFSRSKLVEQDLFDPSFVLADADIYFIYDYGHVEHIERTLKQIKEVARKRPIKVVARGKYSRIIIKENHPWLELKYESKPEEMFSIYGAYLHH